MSASRVAEPLEDLDACARRPAAAGRGSCPGVSEKSMSEPNWRMRPSIGWSYSATRPRRSLSPSNSTRSPAFGVDRDLVGDARGVEQRATTGSRCVVAKRGSSNVSSCRRFSARAARVAKRGSVASSGSAERGAQRVPVRVFHRRDLDPALLRLVQAVQRVDTGLRLVEARPRARLRRRRASRRTRTSSRRRAATSRAPGPRRSRAGGTARRGTRRPRASRWRCRSCRSAGRSACCPRAPGPARTRARPTPGRAGRDRRSARADLRGRTPTCCSRRCRGSRACSPRSRCRAAPRRPRSCCGARCRRARRAAARSRGRARS